MSIETKEVLAALARLEGKIELLTSVIMQTQSHRADDRREPHESKLPKMTTKQHAALQMLLAGASNIEIAKRFGVTDNTAKVYVRTIAGKLGVHSRAQIILKVKDAFDAMRDDDYRIESGGLPKDWHAHWKRPDPYKHLYYGGD